ncbi:hypothetical protein BB560_001683 [Smittium megazygosporum]|uniref:LysM domain-containing protein n=1 Tax=Smittium megazygosporum TaxID=133381 RepID=A0A2T9ZGV2_9FUNG|nr:hypothetical protein BB560_001683 [Smittium megazygosporum]
MRSVLAVGSEMFLLKEMVEEFVENRGRHFNHDFYYSVVARKLLSDIKVIYVTSRGLPTPKQNSDGTCAYHTVFSGDYCLLIAQKNLMSTDDIEKYKVNAWNWTSSSNLQMGMIICIYPETPHFPEVVSNAKCGPSSAGNGIPSDLTLSLFKITYYGFCSSSRLYLNPLLLGIDYVMIPLLT